MRDQASIHVIHFKIITSATVAVLVQLNHSSVSTKLPLAWSLRATKKSALAVRLPIGALSTSHSGDAPWTRILAILCARETVCSGIPGSKSVRLCTGGQYDCRGWSYLAPKVRDCAREAGHIRIYYVSIHTYPHTGTRTPGTQHTHHTQRAHISPVPSLSTHTHTRTHVIQATHTPHTTSTHLTHHALIQ